MRDPQQVSQERLSCQTEFLQSGLGWTLEPRAGEQLEQEASDICELDRAAPPSTLRAKLPASAQSDPASLALALAALLDSKESRCAYKLRLADATRRAAEQMIGNRAFEFGGSFDRLFAESECGWRYVPEQYVTIPSGKPSEAIQCLYHGRGRADCLAGQQLLLWAAQYELFQTIHPTAFDAAFPANEIAIGRLSTSAETPPAALLLLPDTSPDAYAERLAPAGRAGLLGVPGRIDSLDSRVNFRATSLLDSPIDGGENFVILELSADAARSISAERGFNAVNQLARELWLQHLELVCGQPFSKMRDDENAKDLIYGAEAQRWDFNSPGFRRVFDLIDTPEKFAQNCGGKTGVGAAAPQAFRERITAHHPAYSGLMLYVHPLGRMTLGQHIARLLSINPRVPYEVRIYDETPERDRYRRFQEQFVDRCTRGR